MRAAVGALTLWLAPGAVTAQEWHEAYRSGLAALARRDYAGGVAHLQRAVALHPQPGRNVLTYGTNVEPRYFPYLRLAEAYLSQGQLDAAAAVLEKSKSWGREPADERQALEGRLEATAAARRPAAPALTPSPSASGGPPSPPSPTPEATPVPAPSAVPVPSTLATPPVTVAPQAPATPLRSERRAADESPPARPDPTAPAADDATGTLEILSQPPGVSVYIDDAPVGSTDPETGRLVKTKLTAGPHRVRLAIAGHQDAVREILVLRGGSVTFDVALKPQEAASGSPARWIAFGVVAIALVVVFGWIALRRSAESISPIGEHTPRSARTLSGKADETPSEYVNPGARRDERGQDWFGDFKLLDMLGRGGMASVYSVERRSEVSALKRPLATFLDDPGFLERFLREAEIGRTLNHPNIVRILERGDVGRVPYFTMELLAGETVQVFLRNRGAVEPRLAATIVAQVAEALDFAHSKGVIHRDLKPSNIMLLPGDVAKVMDFGIARARRFEGITVTGAFLGTPDYVAPEMIEGRGTEPRSDLYALGVVLYELLTGRRPFVGDTAFAILKKHCTEEPPSPALLKPGVPPALEAIVMQLLRKEPEQRPADAERLVVALRDWLNRAA
jgi:hypothetical protein